MLQAKSSAFDLFDGRLGYGTWEKIRTFVSRINSGILGQFATWQCNRSTVLQDTIGYHSTHAFNAS